jgi:hypothetical protein
MQGKTGDVARNRRRIISDALKRAQEHFDVPRDSILKPTASITLTGGERVVARHIDFEDERVELIVTAKDGYFDTVITHVDDITAIRISDDGRRKHVEPANAEFVMKKLIGEVIENKLCPLLSDDVDLRELVRTEKGLDRIEDAAAYAKDDNLPGVIADAIDHGKFRLGELSETHRDALCHVFATSAARELVEGSWKPFVREVDWMAAIVASAKKPA